MDHQVFGARCQSSDPMQTMERARAFCSATGSSVQLFDAGRVYGRMHLETAARCAIRAHRMGSALSSSLGNEILLYAAGSRQMKQAVARVGITSATREAAGVVVGSASVDGLLAALGWERDDSVLRENSAVLDAMGITEAERAAVGRARWADLVVERVALVALEK